LRVLEQAVSDLGCAGALRGHAAAGLDLVETHGARIVLVDLDSSDQNLELLKAILVVDPGAEVIVAAGTSPEFAMAAIVKAPAMSRWATAIQ